MIQYDKQRQHRQNPFIVAFMSGVEAEARRRKPKSRPSFFDAESQNDDDDRQQTRYKWRISNGKAVPVLVPKKTLQHTAAATKNTSSKRRNNTVKSDWQRMFKHTFTNGVKLGMLRSQI
jgi:hypothetical protein